MFKAIKVIVTTMVILILVLLSFVAVPVLIGLAVLAGIVLIASIIVEAAEDDGSDPTDSTQNSSAICINGNDPTPISAQLKKPNLLNTELVKKLASR